MEEELLSVRQLSKYLHLSTSTIYRAAEKNEVPYIRLKRQIRFSQKRIDEWLKEKTCKLLPQFSTYQQTLNPYPGCAIPSLGGKGEMPKGKSRTRYNFGFGAVYQKKTKEGNIRWYLDFRNAEKKRIQKVIPDAITFDDAVLALKTEIAKVFSNRYGLEEQKKKAMGFKDFSKIYLQDYIMITRRNWKSDEYRLKNLDAYFKDTDLRMITPLMVERLKASRKEEGNANSTINRYLALLKKMFNLTIEEGYMEENPVKKVKFYSEKDNHKERVLTREEEKRLIKESPSHLKSIIIIALNTGMRPGEILNLKWDQVDFNHKRIRVEKTKSGKIRFINVNDPLFRMLSELKVNNGNYPFLFFNKKTEKPLTRVSTAFCSACKRADIKGLRLHDLRHTFATRLVEKGVDIETIKSLLGHYSIIVTQRYTHSSDEMKQRAVELLNEEPEKGQNLWHSCDMEKEALAEKTFRRCPNSSYSTN